MFDSVCTLPLRSMLVIKVLLTEEKAINFFFSFAFNHVTHNARLIEDFYPSRSALNQHDLTGFLRKDYINHVINFSLKCQIHIFISITAMNRNCKDYYPFY